MGKKVKRLLGGFLAVTMFLGNNIAALADSLEYEGAQRTLRECGNVLYMVEAGTNTPETPVEGYTLGYCQSNVDQSYGADPMTGKRWGYVEDGSKIIYGKRDDGAGKITSSLRYLSDKVAYDNDVTGIQYRFEVPSGKYEVTLGFYNPWDARPADISINGNKLESVNVSKNTQIEKTYTVSCEDGTLDVWVHNSKRTSSSQDALLSYIFVKVPETMDNEYLTNALQQYNAGDEASYSPSSYAKYVEARSYVERLLNNSDLQQDEECIKSYVSKLKYHFEHLEAKGNPVTYGSFTGTDGAKWYDTEGTEIQAHGGQVQKFTYNGETKWYWYGEDKTDGYRTVGGGVRVYSSTDLYNWKNEGVALRNLTDMYDFEEDYFDDLYKDYTEEQKQAVLLAINDTTSVIERPKVIYNEKTGKYVMWFHADGPTETSNSNYAAASAGCAVSDSPTGPFKFIHRSRLNYVNGAHDSSKGMARDMNLFVDDDKTGYIIYSSEENQTMIIAKLNEDYTALACNPDEAAREYDSKGYSDYFTRINIYIGKAREAPALFKYNNKYYLMTSACTGWGANAADYAVADSVLGNWTSCGNPCVTNTSVCRYGADLTFGTQSTAVFEYEPGKYIYMGDRWNTSSPAANELVAPTYVWLPVELTADGKMTVNAYNNWDLQLMDKLTPISVKTELPKVVKKNGIDTLPEKVSVLTADGKTNEYKVEWSVSNGSISEAGKYVTVTGKLPSLNNREFTAEMFVYSPNFVYMIDSAANISTDYTDDTFSQVKKLVHNLKNDSGDVEYTENTGWGYVAGSYDGAKAPNNTLGINGTGFYGANNGSKNVTYKVTLDKGNYILTSEQFEWWSGPRTTVVSVSYDNGNGVEKKTLGQNTIKGSGSKDYVTGEFSVNKDNTTVTVEFARGTSGDGGVVSYFTIEKDATDYSGEFGYDSAKLPAYVTGIESMPSTFIVKYGEDEVETGVTWTVESSELYAGQPVILKGICDKGTGVINHSAILYSDDLVYFVDCGANAQATSNTTYENIKNLLGEKLKSETDTTAVSASYKGKDYRLEDLFQSGAYGSKAQNNSSGQNLSYKLTLDKGTYEFVSGHYEWWNTGKRATDITVSYMASGENVTQKLGTVTLSGKKGDKKMFKNTFEVPVDSTEVTITFGYNSAGTEAGAVGYFAITDITPKEVIIDRTVLTILPDKASTFNDGKFEGWGTSFCWWANRIGYSDEMSSKAADYFYGKDGLSMDIVRYNIGGGDDPSHNHITRTDSEMPGYWKNPEVIVDGKTIVAATAPKTEENRVTIKSGNATYSWAYDWTQDCDQRNVLLKAIESYGDDLIVEAFSNSPPYFMTNSLCSSGAVDAGKNNLRDDAYTAFAKYMADVAAHFRDEYGITFQSITPMNEPYTNYWGANSNKQEGCHFDQGKSMSDIIVALHDAMVANGFEDGSIIYSATDETSVDTAITSYKKLSEDAKKIVTRIDSHTYSGSNYSGLKDLADKYGQNLWMSEVDGSGTKGENAGEMSAGLYFASLIQRDMNGLLPSAWIMWQVIDNHVSANGRNDKKDSGMVNLNGGYWGCAVGDHDNQDIILTKKYYSMGQFTRYIRPGYTIIGGTGDTLCALDTKNNRLVIVAVNYSAEDLNVDFDLSMFGSVGEKATAVRTSATENWAELGEMDTYEDGLYACLKGNSITTYIVEGVTFGNGENALKEIEISKSQVSGSAPWNNGTKDVAANVVDGDLSTFFDGVGNGYVIIDLGEEYNLSAFAFAPRSGFNDRCKDAIVAGSKDGDTWTRIYTVPTNAASGLNMITAKSFATKDSFRYIKYYVPDADHNCNIAELKLYGTPKNQPSEDDTTIARVSEVEGFGATVEGMIPNNLPRTTQVKLKNGKWSMAEITWRELEAGNFAKAFDRVEIKGTVTDCNNGNTFDVSTFVQVVPENILYFIDCATKDTGSKAFDAVSNAVVLKNKVSDCEKSDSTDWGYSGIDGSYTSDSDMASLFATGHYGRNKSEEPVMYTLPVKAGTYDITMYVHNWWGARSMDVTYEMDINGKKETGTIASKYSVKAHGTNDYQTLTLEELNVPSDTNLVLKFTANSGNDGAIINFIALCGEEKEKSVEPETPSSSDDGTDSSESNTVEENGRSAAAFGAVSTLLSTPDVITLTPVRRSNDAEAVEDNTEDIRNAAENEKQPADNVIDDAGKDVERKIEEKADEQDIANEEVALSDGLGKEANRKTFGFVILGAGLLLAAGIAVYLFMAGKKEESE